MSEMAMHFGEIDKSKEGNPELHVHKHETKDRAMEEKDANVRNGKDTAEITGKQTSYPDQSTGLAQEPPKRQ